ncbi:uncharacterized protein METZ01_LOCUS511194, partial [marine metagenome]
MGLVKAYGDIAVAPSLLQSPALRGAGGLCLAVMLTDDTPVFGYEQGGAQF